MSTIATELLELEDFTRTRSEGAFARIVGEHGNWVYSAARRMVRDGELAEDVTQAVFLLLWQRPEKVKGALGAWLYKVTRYCAANALRGEGRRAKYERRAAAMMREEISDEGKLWEGVEPVVEELVGRMREKDREVILLRFYQGKSMGEISEVLGISEEAARKRVGAAVQKLQDMFKGRGVDAPAAVLMGAMWGRMTSAMPAGLKAKVIAGGAGASGTVLGLTEGARHMMWMMKVKVGAAVTAVVILAGGGGWMAAHDWARAEAPVRPVVQQVAMATTTPAAKGLDLSTPENAIKIFCEAVGSGDRERTYGCLTADSKPGSTAIDSMLDVNLAGNRMVAEAKKKFGDQATLSSFGFLGIETMTEMISTAAGPKGLTQEGNGEEATLSAVMPPEAMARIPRGAQQVAKLWSGAPMRFKKVGAEWRIDLEHSMAVALNGHMPTEAESERIKAANDAAATRMDEVAGEIRDGGIETLALAKSVVRRGMGDAYTEHGIQGNMMVVPVGTKGMP